MADKKLDMPVWGRQDGGKAKEVVPAPTPTPAKTEETKKTNFPDTLGCGTKVAQGTNAQGHEAAVYRRG